MKCKMNISSGERRLVWSTGWIWGAHNTCWGGEERDGKWGHCAGQRQCMNEQSPCKPVLGLVLWARPAPRWWAFGVTRKDSSYPSPHMQKVTTETHPEALFGPWRDQTLRALRVRQIPVPGSNFFFLFFFFYWSIVDLQCNIRTLWC